MTDDVEELLKTAANQVTDSLVTEVNTKIKSGDDTAQKVEDSAAEMNTLLSQVCMHPNPRKDNNKMPSKNSIGTNYGLFL